MASTSFIAEAGRLPSAATGGTAVITSAVATSLARSNPNSNSNSNHPNANDSSTAKFMTINNSNSNLKGGSNSLRTRHNETGGDRTSSSTIPSNIGPKTTKYRGRSGSHSETNSTLHNHRQNHNSSKLPAFRFADLRKDALVRPTPLQRHVPPSPVSPTPAAADPVRRSAESPESVDADRADKVQPIEAHRPQRDLQQQNDKPTQRSRHIPATSPEGQLRNSVRETEKSSPASEPHAQHNSQLSPSRTRASTFPATSPANTLTPPSSKRPASFPDSPTAAATISETTQAAKSRQPRAPAPSLPESNGTSIPSGNGATLTHPRRAASDSATKDWAQGQRELLLPKAVDATKSDDKRRSRPPVSFRPPNITAAASPRAVIPPIRGFRSSGSRKSLVLDMNSTRMSYDGSSDGSSDPNHRDRTLRALEGRTEDDYSHITPPDSAEAPPDESTADIFMRIAREDTTRRSHADNRTEDERNTIVSETLPDLFRWLSCSRLLPCYVLSLRCSPIMTCLHGRLVQTSCLRRLCIHLVSEHCSNACLLSLVVAFDPGLTK